MPEMDSSVLLSQILGDKELTNQIQRSRILLVGAGGIGSEVIKDLLLMGFQTINVIDLDTIDVSNLNRQFLFNRQHVGKSKAEIAARVAVESFGHSPDVDVKAIHNSIQSPEFDIDFYKSHTLVINALDNKSARSHVNRMCLAADVPLIESGSEGYMGQVFLIRKNITQCYECNGPKADSKSFASCTIRNTPSLPIHCIVWAKHLFAQLFGEVDADADNDVSPDMNDPELEGNKSEEMDSNSNENNESNTNGSARLQSTRDWAQKRDYDIKQLFDKLFQTDIEYLLRMDKLWENRQKPFAISYEKVLSNQIEFDSVEGSSHSSGSDGSGDSGQDLKDQRLWSINECLHVFADSIAELKSRLKSENFLVWDKDDEPALNFVTAVSNLRSFCFHISRKSKFDVKSMAGNIIPAISSTNSIVGGLIVLQSLNVLRHLIRKNDTTKEESDNALYDSCRHVYLRKVGPSAKNLIAPYELQKPNPNCLICSSSVPEIEISLSLSETLLFSEFVEQIILGKLHFVSPDIQIDGQSVVLFSKDDYDESSEAEKLRTQKKMVSDYSKVADKVRLRVYDLLTELEILITLRDIKIDRNENEGLFYKLVITKEADNAVEGNGVGSDGVNGQSKDKSSESESKDSTVTQITVEDDDETERTSEMECIEANDDNNVEEVTISDTDDSNSSDNPVIIDDDSVDIIEVREKRKLVDDSDSVDTSVIKKLKSYANSDN